MKYRSERVSSWVAVGLMGLALLGCFLGTIFFAIMGNQTKEGLIATDAFSYSEADDFITLWGPISVFFPHFIYYSHYFWYYWFDLDRQEDESSSDYAFGYWNSINSL
ncbi:hypothetical protein [Staphylococcus pettenkoferi]|uniref:hypothetical protein n=1 Tax=Staphylococcus pettenkoferi TaxID=170573 RepID=UPI0012FE7946|nr:hypothetical protein [Staphylococcus pettenkoferi]